MYSVLVYLLRPYTLACGVTGVAIVSLWRKRQASKRHLLLLTFGFASMMILSLRAVSYLGLGSLEWSFPPLRYFPADAEAIVVLSGSFEPPDGVRLETAMGSDTLHRCLHAAEVYHRGGPRTVLVSGGNVDPGSPGPSYAQLMGDLLIKLGVDASDLRIEPNSRSTYENAVECRKLLDRSGIRKIILVTEATHMARASLCFRKQGIEVVPGACRHRATHFDLTILNFLPSPLAAVSCSDVFHEWLGLAWYRLRGRI